MSRALFQTTPTIRSVPLATELDVEVFAKKLKEAREQRDLSQTALAELLQVSPRVYNRWERGAAVPRLDTVVRIADILQVSLDELAGRSEPSTPELRVRHPKLHSLYRQIDKLTPEDQQALLVLLDSLIKRSEMSRVLAG